MTGTSSVGIPDTYKFTDLTSNPTMYVIVIVITLIYFVIFALLGMGKKDSNGTSTNGATILAAVEAVMVEIVA